MKKVTKMPIGLGMNHLEQEIAACHVWNAHIDAGSSPDEWVALSEWAKVRDLFEKNMETGFSLENSGFLEVDRNAGKFRLTASLVKIRKRRSLIFQPLMTYFNIPINLLKR